MSRDLAVLAILLAEFGALVEGRATRISNDDSHESFTPAGPADSVSLPSLASFFPPPRSFLFARKSSFGANDRIHDTRDPRFLEREEREGGGGERPSG